MEDLLGAEHGWVELPLQYCLFVINQLAAIELVRRKLSNLRMHPVLDLQHVVLDTAVEESFEHGATVSRIISVLRENSCWQLLLITNEDDFLRLMLERNQVRKLDRLACFINDKVLEITQ